MTLCDRLCDCYTSAVLKLYEKNVILQQISGHAALQPRSLTPHTLLPINPLESAGLLILPRYRSSSEAKDLGRIRVLFVRQSGPPSNTQTCLNGEIFAPPPPRVSEMSGSCTWLRECLAAQCNVRHELCRADLRKFLSFPCAAPMF